MSYSIFAIRASDIGFSGQGFVGLYLFTTNKSFVGFGRHGPHFSTLRVLSVKSQRSFGLTWPSSVLSQINLVGLYFYSKKPLRLYMIVFLCTYIFMDYLWDRIFV